MITPTLITQWYDGKKLWTKILLAFSGNYTSGGDTLNLQGLGIQSSGITKYPRVTSTSAVAGQTLNSYLFVPGTNQSNGLVRCFVGTAEVSTGAYPAAISGDVAIFEANFVPFR